MRSVNPIDSGRGANPVRRAGTAGLSIRVTGEPMQAGAAVKYNASQVQRREPPAMKTSTLPSLRVEPELREAAESVLQEGETLSGFIEASVRETIERRRTRGEFIARGLISRDEAKRTGVYFAADDVHAELGRMLAKAKAKLQKKARA